MKVTINGRRVYVTLSRRNLLILLSKLCRKDSSQIIFKDTPDARIFICAESDEEHYKDGNYGVMHPLDEAFVKKFNKGNF